MTKVLILQFGEMDVTFTSNILQLPKPVLPNTMLSVRLVKGFTTGVPFDKLESDQKKNSAYVTEHIGKTLLTPNTTATKTITRDTEVAGEMRPTIFGKINVPTKNKERIFQKSGQMGMITFELGERSEGVGIQRLPTTTSLKDALEITAALGTSTMGVVPTRKGWAIRAANADIPNVKAKINPDLARVTGEALMNATEQDGGMKFTIHDIPQTYNALNTVSYTHLTLPTILLV